MDLGTRWAELLPDAVSLGAVIIARYGGSHRHYHDVRHLREVLSAVDELAHEALDPDAVHLAAWFHDAVYDPQADDNEERSAQLAESELPAVGVSTVLADEVARLVRLTGTHKPDPADRNGAVVCDADLWILAADNERYRQYTRDVRAEHPHVPGREFRARRAAVLSALLDDPPLFRTSAGHERWEARARENVTQEVRRLQLSA